MFKQMKKAYIFTLKNIRYSSSKLLTYLNSLLFTNYYTSINKIQRFPAKLQLILYNKFKAIFSSILLQNLTVNIYKLFLININYFKFYNLKKRMPLAKGQTALRSTNFSNYRLLFSEY